MRERLLRKRHVRGVKDEGMELLLRRAGMGAVLGVERHVPGRRVDSVEHEIPCTRHRHQLSQSLQDDLPVGPSFEEAVRRPRIERVTRSTIPAHRPKTRTKEYETDAGMAGKHAGHPWVPRVQFLVEQWLGAIREVDERIRPRRYHADRLLGRSPVI